MSIRTKIRLTAIGVSLAYTVIRVLLVQAALSGYGVSPWIFLLIDAAAGVAYVLALEQLVVAVLQRSKNQMWRIMGWAGLTAAAFAVPYLYIFAFSRELPASFILGLGVIVAVLLGNAVFSVLRRVRRNRTR